MNLSTRLDGESDAAVRQRGRSYYIQGRVRILHGGASEVEARVRGSRSYEVSLDFAAEVGVLNAWCDCPYFGSDGPCKHVWATVLAADAQGYLSAAAAAPDVVLDCGEYDPNEDPECPDEEDLEDTFALLSPVAAVAQPVAPNPPAWLQRVTEISRGGAYGSSGTLAWPAKRRILYLVDATSSALTSRLELALVTSDRKADGGWSQHNPLKLKHSQVAHVPLPEDREILGALAGAKQRYAWSEAESYLDFPSYCTVAHPLATIVMQLALRTGRCYLRGKLESEAPTPLAWDDGGPWQFGLEMRRGATGGWAVVGFLRRGEERLDLSAPLLITQGGLVFTDGRVAPLAEDTLFDWMFHLRKAGSLDAPDAEGEELLAALLTAPNLPPLEVPEELRYEEVAPQPRPGLRIRAADHGKTRLRAELSFDYDGRIVPAAEKARGFYDAATRRFLRRDAGVEKAATALLDELGLKFQTYPYQSIEPAWEMAPTKLPRIVRALVEAGWHIEADGKVFRRPGAFHMEVSSGVDWFDLHGQVDYGESQAPFPALLEALRRGEKMVRLDDGSYGMLPEEWLHRFGMMAAMGTPDKDHVRFRRSQAGLLDALLATQPEARCDETFARVRRELRLFQGVEAAEQPAGFVGQLRDYQREGLGWMGFLSRFSFGGCLADDMGVGKTPQVLALLERRREQRAAGERVAPSLVVVPKSLIFNWKQEAARFTPQLRVLDHSGLARDVTGFAGYDIVLTTYGTLRRDVVDFKDIEFDYVVLDEAQAIKNAATESAKAARLLRGANRLALSGTPIENHLGELWSLFEFLNPGMLGTANVFKMAGGATRNPDEETRKLLAHAVRPFLLRRTKEQVARELPAKTEQTIYCEMEPAQRRLYNELRQHYRNALLRRVDDEGLAKSKIQVLEALLRLRQAACHPGLIDKKRCEEGSAKLDVLLEQLREVLDEGHKALVFSQFTSLLDIVRSRLDKQGMVYEYLDGATRDRQRPVERFQNDPGCQLFLISLKAGGLGLNLTAAGYVFLLDPWWNPAVEAQAVDRAHRIGQTQQVFAYRLIARDTVEEKVLELQRSKRDLAAAIVTEDNSLIRNLRREDLELLLS
jgi:hypothetical protein